MIDLMTESTEHSTKKQWETKALGDPSSSEDILISDELLQQEAVILAQGRNLFGDPIYSYIKFPMRNFTRLRAAMIAGENFMPSNYGEVLAAGQGEPNADLREEMALKWGLIDTPKPETTEQEPKALNSPRFFDEDEGF